MAEMLFDAAEREQLCDLLDALGPLAPTCLGSWTTHDLAAQLVMRERDPLAAPGLVLHGAWGRLAERRRLVRRRSGFNELVAMLRSGPPPGLFRIRWVRRGPNLNEFFVYHEDVRRANGCPRRLIPAEEQAELFRNLGFAPWYPTRRLRGIGLEFERAGTGQVVTARRGQPTVRVRGDPGELLLFLFGRSAADVQIAGPPGAIETLRQTPFGM
jgi:uncharacterized protein (TIGR03085 family)